jgi:hypothetical protein
MIQPHNNSNQETKIHTANKKSQSAEGKPTTFAKVKSKERANFPSPRQTPGILGKTSRPAPKPLCQKI